MRKESFESRQINLVVSGVRNVILALILIPVFSLISVYSQMLSARPEQGSGSNGGYQNTNIDSVNLQNGGISLNIPLASLPPIAGGKLGYTLTATYNSKLWSLHQSEVRPAYQPVGCPMSYSTQSLEQAEGSGWTIGGEYQIFFRGASEDYGYIPADSELCYGYEWYHMEGYFFKPMLRMPDGSEHELRFQTYVPAYPGQRDHLEGFYKMPTGGFTTALRMHTIDGTFITVEKNAPNSSIDSIIHLKDGTRIETSSAGQRTIDTNGNSILMGSIYSPTYSRFIRDERTGREIKISPATYNGQPAWKVEYQAVGGEWKATYVVWGTTTVVGKVYGKTGWNPNGGEFGYGDICYLNENLQDTPMNVIREIVLPATESGVSPQKYTFEYNSDTTEYEKGSVLYSCGNTSQWENYNRDASIGWGEISEVTTPTGAQINYEHAYDGIHTFSQGSQYDGNDVIRNVITKKKVTHDGQTDEWTYSVTTGMATFFSGGSVTNPDGSSHSETYNPVDIAYSGRGGSDGMGGMLIRSSDSNKIITEKKWAALGGFVPSIGAPTDIIGINRVVDTEFTSLLDDQGNRVKMSAKKYQYDFNGDVTQVIDYDWFDPTTVTYSTTFPVGFPTAVPAGATVLRVTNTSYYNQAAGAASPTAYQNRNVSPTGRVLLGFPMEATVGNGTTVKSTTHWSFDGNTFGTVPNKGNTTKVSQWDDVDSQWIDSQKTYDTYGNVTSKTDPKGNVTNIYYADSTLAMPTSTVIDPQNGTGAQTASITYDYYTGLPLSSTDVNGNVSSINYTNHLLGSVDPYGRPGTISGPYVTVNGASKRQAVKTFYEDSARTVRTWSDLFNENDGLAKSRESYDQLGRPVLKEKNENGSTTYPISSQTIYNTANRVVLVSNARKGTAASTDGWTRITNDLMGNPVEVGRFSGASQPPLTGTNSNWTGGMVMSFAANTRTVTDEAGKTRRAVTNAIGQFIRIDEPNVAGQLDVSGSPVQSTNYTYDVLGNLTQVSQGSQTRTFTYSSLSRMLTAANPESGTTSYLYDKNSNLTRKTDARGIQINYTYDAFSRVTFQDYTDSTPDVTYVYENNNIAYSKGKLTKIVTGIVSNPFSITEYLSFDVMGRITRSKQTTDGGVYGTDEKPMTYKYDLSGALVEQKYPSGRIVKNVLDMEGKLAVVQSKKNPTSGPFWDYAQNFTYNAAGAVTSMQLGNGHWESTSFNSRMQPTQIALGITAGATNLLRLEYTYGSWEGQTLNTQKNNGNIAQQLITVPTVGSNPGFQAMQLYSYDSLNRLNQSTELINAGVSWQQTFTYDRYGNRTFNEAGTTTLPKNCSGAVCPADRKLLNPSISAANNRINTDQDGDSVADYTFDNTGNTTKMADGRSFVYDAENKQIEVKNSSNQTIGQYWYDGHGKRVKKYIPATGETTIFVYDAFGKSVAEYSTALAPTPLVSYLTNDHLGSPRINTDRHGTVISRHDYHPFGEEIATSQRLSGFGYAAAADTVSKKFTGYERDGETGLDYANARYYSSTLGRFSSPDNFLNDNDPTDPQRWNLYVYARNNPLRYTDPTGERILIKFFETGKDGEQVEMTVEYKNGKLYNMDGSEYTGKNQYALDALAFINTMAKDYILGFMVKDLVDSKKVHTVKKDAKNPNRDETVKNADGGTTVYWANKASSSPMGREGRATFSAYNSLAHELLGHAWFIDKGKLREGEVKWVIKAWKSADGWRYITELKNACICEIDAIDVENRARAIAGEELRTILGGIDVSELLRLPRGNQTTPPTLKEPKKKKKP